MADIYLQEVEETQADSYQQITDEEKNFAELWDRMDSDKKLLILDKFVWRDKDDREEPDVENITMNDAATFAHHVHNTLIKAGIIPEVSYDGMEVEGKKDEVSLIFERFIRDVSLEADAYVYYQDIPSYKNFEILQACDRGRIARRVTLREENGQLTPDSFLAVDTRYLVYRYNINGLAFVATKMPRSREDVEAEYGYSPTGKDVIITDYWNSKLERVYCGRELIHEGENYWREPPFVIQVVPTGVFTFDADRMLYDGESIFASVRELFKEKNQIATMLKSSAVRSFFNGLQIEVENVALAKKPAMPPYRKKIVAPIQKGTKGYFSMPIERLTDELRMLYTLVDEAIQHGTIPKVSYGTYPAPASGVGITQLKQAEDPVYFPRIQGYTLFLQRLYRMIIKQYTMFKMNIQLGEPGYKTQYNWRDLQKEIALNFHVELVSPEQDMVNISTAAALGNLISDDTKMRDYLRIKNPDEETRKKLLEKASRVSPVVEKFDIIMALFKSGETVKANLMAMEMGLTLDQLMSGQPPAGGAPAEEQPPRQLIPMFGGQRASPNITGQERQPEGGGNASP